MKIKILVVVILLVSVAILFFSKKEDLSFESEKRSNPVSHKLGQFLVPQTEESSQAKSKHEKNKNESIKHEKSEIDLRMQPSLTDKEIESISIITKALGRTLSQKMNSTEFMKLLTDLKLKPKFMDQGSSALGSFISIRTNNTLDGTRYIHAQFTGEHKKADYLQHFSFQIRPGSDSFEQANKLLNQILPKNRTIKESYNDYALYSTSDGYVAWVKIADIDDLRSNKYNAYSPDDVGSIIVTVEQEIHGMDEDH